MHYCSTAAVHDMISWYSRSAGLDVLGCPIFRLQPDFQNVGNLKCQDGDQAILIRLTVTQY
jgi:hypothetical protein